MSPLAPPWQLVSIISARFFKFFLRLMMMLMNYIKYVDKNGKNSGILLTMWIHYLYEIKKNCSSFLVNVQCFWSNYSISFSRAIQKCLLDQIYACSISNSNSENCTVIRVNETQTPLLLRIGQNKNNLINRGYQVITYHLSHIMSYPGTYLWQR